MEKELDIRMEKLYDFKDGEAEKYEILAYFKEKERVKNNILNAAVTEQLQQVANISLSQQIAMGLTDEELRRYQQSLINSQNIATGAQPSGKRKSKSNVTARSCTYVFSVTDLILCIIAFLLLLLLILR